MGDHVSKEAEEPGMLERLRHLSAVDTRRNGWGVGRLLILEAVKKAKGVG